MRVSINKEQGSRRICVLFGVLVMVSMLISIGCGGSGGGGGATGKGATLTDSRDKKEYRTVMVNGERWMAENLNYAIEGSVCYEERLAYCETYGRLYTWDDAVSACPVGWRLPTNDDWDKLLQTAGDESGAGRKLKAESRWEHPRNIGGGTDDFGFAALPGGIYNQSTDYRDRTEFRGIGVDGDWWSATVDTGSVIKAYAMCMESDRDNVNRFTDFKGDKRSVRCIQDKKKYTLSAKSVPIVGGGADLASSQNITVGAQTNITAKANSGFKFLGWAVSDGLAWFADDDSAVTTVALSTNATIIAYFQQLNRISGTTLTDPRDQQEYSTVRIGDLTWMAQNLNYEMENSRGYGSQYVDAGYGRLYTWEAAMSACPAGWRLPDNDEWFNLLVASGEPTRLRSKIGWRGRNATSGTDDIGFSALPGGGYHDRRFNEIGESSIWWSSEEKGTNAFRMRLDAWDRDFGLDLRDKNRGISVRCVRN